MIDRVLDRRAEQALIVNDNAEDPPGSVRAEADVLIGAGTPDDDTASSHRPRDAAAADDARQSGYQGDLRPALDLAARWLWRDGRPRALLGHDRAIVWANPAARRLLVPPAPLVIRNNQLCTGEGVDPVSLDTFLDRLTSASTRLLVMDADNDHGVLLTAWADLVENQQVAFIQFGLRELPFDCRESGMAEAFGLTKAECRIVDALALMEAPSTIAERLEVSVHTVRTHIRRIYSKLKVRSQLQFMRLTMAYCGG